LSINREEVYKREEETHDDSHFDENRALEVDVLYSNGSFDNIYRKAYDLLGDLKDKTMLEYGCGFGRNLIDFCNKGANYTGIDISNLRISNANEIIRTKNLISSARAIKMNAEKLEFPDASFDIVYGEAIIHHLDIDLAMQEIKRVLKPDGFALFLEPRGDNPVVNKFRNRTPHLRTIDEHPLVKSDFEIMEKYAYLEVENFYFLSLCSFIFRKFIKSETLFRISKTIYDKVDYVLFALFPFLRKYAWYCIVKLKMKR
jgi:ubiquinone/menaquinone biosynthesis C-methylase UbiE